MLETTTPEEWLQRLEKRLLARWAILQVFDAYYQGDQKLAYETRQFRKAFGSLFQDLTDNYMPLVVDSAAERCQVQGFRFGRLEEASDEAWEIWQANSMDAESQMIHTEAIKLKEAYWLVEPNGSSFPRITAEHPSQVIVACAGGDRRKRVAGLKRWLEEDGHLFAMVYLPDRYVTYRSRQPANRFALETDFNMRWETVAAGSNPLGEVPIVPIQNNPSMLHGGVSDLEGGPMGIQDGINKFLADMFVGSEFQAWPQRVLMGVEPPRDPATGEILTGSQLDNAQKNRFLYFKSKDAKAFEFKSADLTNFRSAIDGMIGDLAAQTRIPIYYFRPAAISNISAEALIGLDAGLVSKVDNGKKPAFGEGHEETMRLAFLAMDRADPRAQATSAETIWRDTETRSQAQLVDSLTKLATIGVPQEILWEKAGFSPQEIDRMKQIQESEELLVQAQETQRAALAASAAKAKEPDAGESPEPSPDAGLPAAA